MRILYLNIFRTFWKVNFATRDNQEVEGFWLKHFMMTTNMNDYFEEDNEKEVGKVFGDTMEGQFEHYLYNKSFSNQLAPVETYTLQQIIKWWMVVVDKGGPIPNDISDYIFGELFGLYRKAIDPEMQQLVTKLRDRQIIPLKKFNIIDSEIS